MELGADSEEAKWGECVAVSCAKFGHQAFQSHSGNSG